MMPSTEWVAEKQKTIQRYLDSGREIGKFIMQDAQLVMCGAKHGWKDDPRPEVAAYEQRRIKIYAEVNASVTDIARKCREWMYVHWAGFHPDDVQALIKLAEEWNTLDWGLETPEALQRQTELRALFNPPWDNDVRRPNRDAWQPYFERRVKQPLQEVFAYNTLSGLTDKVKVMVGGTAGHSILTVQDRYDKSDKRGVFGGAWVTMTFDESATAPCGGLYSLCATREEGIGLMQEIIDNMPEMSKDNEVWFV